MVSDRVRRQGRAEVLAAEGRLGVLRVSGER